jgi:hypothetical protein
VQPTILRCAAYCGCTTRSQTIAQQKTVSVRIWKNDSPRLKNGKCLIINIQKMGLNWLVHWRIGLLRRGKRDFYSFIVGLGESWQPELKIRSRFTAAPLNGNKNGIRKRVRVQGAYENQTVNENQWANKVSCPNKIESWGLAGALNRFISRIIEWFSLGRFDSYGR